MAAATSPFVMNKAFVLTLKKVGEATAAAPFQCVLNKAVITPSTGSASTQTYETFCAKYTDSSGGGAEFTLDLGGFQAWSDVADLSVMLWNDAGTKYEFTLVPNLGAPDPDNPPAISATNYGFQGEVTLVEPPVGGTANQYATFEVSLPCTSKPTMLTAPPAVQADAFAFAE